ncbi:hypothetical protein EVAR_80045_1 [Eumeta japonica]|uniref:DUF5641 domain-containing protein n=1 Tax=Eumeta variegata TaxID=151549 RepID=A0A4C1WM77_EUMVA|nr:hypothetical protein EVAR_80045_1 [Eumeta japonica]
MTYVTTDPEAPESLTPNHFFLRFCGCSCARHSTGVGLEQPRAVARLSTTSRYVLEPLASGISAELQHRREPRSQRSIKIGDVVLIADNTLPRKYLVVSSQRYIQALMVSHGSQTSKQRTVYCEDPRRR